MGAAIAQGGIGGVASRRMNMDENLFETVAQRALEFLATTLEDAGDFEVDLENGVLTVEVDDVGTFLVNKHAPLRQIWYSSPISGATHYDFDADAGAWVSTRGGDDLAKVLTTDFAAGPGVTLPALNFS